MAHSLTSSQDLIDKKFSTDSFLFPYNKTPDADRTFSKELKGEAYDADVSVSDEVQNSKNYPIRDVDFSISALDASYSEGEASNADVSVSDEVQDNAKSEAYDADVSVSDEVQNSKSEASDADVSVSDEVQDNAKSIVDSKVSKHGSLRYILEYISKPRQRVQQYVPVLLDLVRYPGSLIGRRQRPTFAGHDSANISIDDLRRENEEFNQRLTCIICYTNLRNVVFIPCGHVVVCSGCKHKIGQQCPICRRKIVKKKKCLYE